MKHLNLLALLSTLTLLFPLFALARDKNQHSVNIGDTVRVGSKYLRAGSYKIEWEGTGPAVQVTFQRYGKIVATTTATLQKNDKQVTEDAIVTHKIDPKTDALDEIDFDRQKEALVFASQGGM